MKKVLLFLLSAVVLFSSCRFVTGKKIRGNGNVQTVSRNETGFTGVHSSGSFDIYVSTGSANSVKIEAEENILPYIETYVENGILKIDTKDGVWLDTKRDVKIYITAPEYNEISSSGSGDIIGQNLLTSKNKLELKVSGSADIKAEVDAPAIEASSSGSGDMELKGQTKTFKGDVTGSGNIHAMDLKTEETTIKIVGSGDAEVYASVKLEVHVSGSGDITYKGNAQVNSHIAGSGSVKKLD
ncbi:MAG: head GIN domain-containing protein [Chitinophagaceae bacterium]